MRQTRSAAPKNGCCCCCSSFGLVGTLEPCAVGWPPAPGYSSLGARATTDAGMMSKPVTGVLAGTAVAECFLARALRGCFENLQRVAS